MILKGNKNLIFIVFIILSLMIIYQMVRKDKPEYKDDSVDIQSKEKSNSVFDEKTSFILPEHSAVKFIAGDFNSNGTTDSLFLSVDAEIDKKGRIAYDDSNFWAAYIKSNDKTFGLFNAEIQLGRLELYYNERDKRIFMVKNAPNGKAIYEINGYKNFSLTKIDKLPVKGRLIELILDK